jgi:hypothetical protein
VCGAFAQPNCGNIDSEVNVRRGTQRNNLVSVCSHPCRRKPSQPTLLVDGDGLKAIAKGVGSPSFHFADHDHVISMEHEVNFAPSAIAPVSINEGEPAIPIPIDDPVFASMPKQLTLIVDGRHPMVRLR